MSLQGVKTILAITGGIAAFKALAVLRLLKQHGADVYVVMSEHATHFVTPASRAMVSGHPVSVALGMNTHMYTNTVVQQHLATLRQRRVHVIEPQYGRVASTLEGQGVGRLAEPEDIVTRVLAYVNQMQKEPLPSHGDRGL